ncbi:hypothetical protein N7516_011208 [Penicillium verrucosum]|uniref:uncharacterized protein n=1 Tax=Penicillium verrucosum TaxID=60171 RepID=UPI002545079C|nr:uncharacterized protein N7516_011208 [Penicillium verrucosum]KAJ5920350.1 hypothetical protein N7516_011208 [Penicillium verrucosum]
MSTSSEPSEPSGSPDPTNPPKRNVPKTPSEWVTAAGDSKSQYLTLHTLSKVHSASKLTSTDFIAMRAVWPEVQFAKRLNSGFDAQIMGKAREVLKNFPEFQAYIKDIKKPNTSAVDRDMGAFLLVRESQKQIPLEPVGKLESDSVDMQESLIEPRKKRKLSPSGQHSKASESDDEAADSSSSSSSTYSEVSAACDSEITPGPTKDEQLVNDALLLFLRALLVYQPELKCQWTAHRSPFSTAVFGRNKMNARTDGYLEANGEVFAIIEVKPNIRAPSVRPELLWQETGEMIAWIMHDEQHRRKCDLRRRLLVSQDNHEIFLTIANYDSRYLAYLKNEETPLGSDGPFLRMNTYGPWNIGYPTHMKELATFILCVAFEVTNDLGLASSS